MSQQLWVHLHCCAYSHRKKMFDSLSIHYISSPVATSLLVVIEHPILLMCCQKGCFLLCLEEQWSSSLSLTYWVLQLATPNCPPKTVQPPRKSLPAFAWICHLNAPNHFGAAALGPRPSSECVTPRETLSIYTAQVSSLLWGFMVVIAPFFLFFFFPSTVYHTLLSDSLAQPSEGKRSCKVQQWCGSIRDAGIISLIDLGRGGQWFPLTDFH